MKMKKRDNGKLLSFIALILLFACVHIGYNYALSSSGDNVLDIPVQSSKPYDKATLQKALEQASQNTTDKNIIALDALKTLFPYAQPKKTAFDLEKIGTPNAQKIKATAIFDRIPDGDSVSSYRYDVIMSFEEGSPQIESAQVSWRCWEDRGHQDFSTAPCL